MQLHFYKQYFFSYSKFAIEKKAKKVKNLVKTKTDKQTWKLNTKLQYNHYENVVLAQA